MLAAAVSHSQSGNTVGVGMQTDNAGRQMQIVALEVPLDMEHLAVALMQYRQAPQPAQHWIA